MAETIDNLPKDVNDQWARSQELLASSPHIKEGQYVAGAQIDVTEPAYPSQLTAFTGEHQANIRWAGIEAPPIYATKKRTDLFTETLIPRLGSNEKLEAIKERLKSLPERPHGQ